MIFSSLNHFKKMKIGIISTARKLTINELEPSLEWLKKLKIPFELGENILCSENQFAGTDSQRATDLQQMILRDDISVIWCARGGYGTARILDLVDFSPLKRSHKWIVGYSDVTALHCHLNRQNIATLHATMPINVANNSEKSLQSLENFLLGKENFYQWENDFSLEGKQKIQAEIVGGNLSVIYSLLGSESSIYTNGKILLLEDLDEYLYHIDRMILNLKRNGLFNNLKALLVGSFTQIHDNATPFGKSVKEIILEHCQEFSFPIIFNAPSGHIDDNRAFVLGKKVSLEIENQQITLRQ